MSGKERLSDLRYVHNIKSVVCSQLGMLLSLLRNNHLSCFSRRVGRKTLLSPRSLPRHIVGKRTAQKDVIKDITSDSQVNSYFSFRWSPASLAFNIYFYLLLYLYITRITINEGRPHLKSPKNQNRRAALGRPAIKLLGEGGGGGALTSLRSTNPHHSTKQGKTLFKIQKHLFFTYFLFFFYHKARRRAKWAAMQVATSLEDHKQTGKKNNFEEPKQKCRLGTASKCTSLGMSFLIFFFKSRCFYFISIPLCYYAGVVSYNSLFISLSVIWAYVYWFICKFVIFQ